MTLRKVGQLAELPVAQFAIEAGRLKAKRIDEGVSNAALACFGFGFLDQGFSKILAPQFFRYPERVDIEPAPIGLADQPANDLVDFAHLLVDHPLCWAIDSFNPKTRH